MRRLLQCTDVDVKPHRLHCFSSSDGMDGLTCQGTSQDVHTVGVMSAITIGRARVELAAEVPQVSRRFAYLAA
jgi:hypothetical protein